MVVVVGVAAVDSIAAVERAVDEDWDKIVAVDTGTDTDVVAHRY